MFAIFLSNKIADVFVGAVVGTILGILGINLKRTCITNMELVAFVAETKPHEPVVEEETESGTTCMSICLCWAVVLQCDRIQDTHVTRYAPHTVIWLGLKKKWKPKGQVGVLSKFFLGKAGFLSIFVSWPLLRPYQLDVLLQETD